MNYVPMTLQPDKHYLRQLEATDWQLLREIRLDALKKEPTVFGSSLSGESERPDSEWQNRLADSNRAYFCLFTDGGETVGLTAVYGTIDGSAVLVASYIKEAYRGRGLSSLLYNARIGWARANGFKKAIVSHREDNLISKAANQRAGFRYTHTE
ncbi:MAG TPA: GNAT family N-acetyltransferase, partial [Fibrella sp.]